MFTTSLFSILQEIWSLVSSRCCIHRWQSKCLSNMPSNDDFSLSVLVGNTVLPEYSHGGVCYVECDLFSPVSFKQRTEERVGQELEVQVGHSESQRRGGWWIITRAGWDQSSKWDMNFKCKGKKILLCKR